MNTKNEQDALLSQCLVELGFRLFTVPSMLSTDTNMQYYVVYPAVEFYMHTNGDVFVYDQSRPWDSLAVSFWHKTTTRHVHSAVRTCRMSYLGYLDRMRRRRASGSSQRRTQAIAYYKLERELRRFTGEKAMTTAELRKFERDADDAA